jgi:hypothetical protein
MRPIEEIRNEITELTERRLALWGELGGASMSEDDKVTELTARIDDLWNELRSTRVVSAHGESGHIRRRADQERRMEIELDRIVELERGLRAA